MIKRISAITISIMLIVTMFLVSPAVFAAEGDITISYPQNGGAVVGDTMKVTASMSDGYSISAVAIDGVNVDIADLSAIDIASLSLGRHSLKVEATSDAEDTISDTIFFSKAEGAAVSGVPISVNGAGGTAYTYAVAGSDKTLTLSFQSSASAGYGEEDTVAFDNGVYTITKSYAGGTGNMGKNYTRMIYTLSDLIYSGVIEVTQTVSFGDTKAYFRPEINFTGSGSSVGINKFIDSGTLFDGTPVSADTDYTLKTYIDLNNKIVRCQNPVTGKFVDTKFDALDTLKFFRFEYRSPSATAVTIKDVSVNYYDVVLPFITSVAYVKDGAETLQESWTKGEFACDADSLKLTLSDAAAVVDAVAPVATLLKNGSAVGATVDTSALPAILVTPEGGFEPDADYAVSISNLKSSATGVAFTSPITASFKAGVVLGIISPKADDITGNNITFSANVPEGETVEFLLDGREMETPALAQDSTFVYTLTTEIPYGIHTFTAKTENDEKSVTFNAVKFGDEKTVEYVAPVGDGAASLTNGTTTGGKDNPVLTQADGVDGAANGAFKIYGPSSDAYDVDIAFATPYSNGMIMFESDLSKNEYAQFELYLGSSKWIADGHPLINQRSGGVSRILDTTKTLTHYEWCNIRVLHEIKNGGKYYVYCNGELIKEGVSAVDTSSISTMRLQLYAAGDDRGCIFDNTKYGNIVTPIFTSAEYKTDAAEEFIAAEDNVISGMAKSIKLSTVGAMFDSAGGVLDNSKVKINGVAVEKAEVSGQDIILTPAENILPDNNAIITFDADMALGGTAIGEEYEIILKTNSDAVDSIGEITIEENGATATAKTVITKQSENSIFGDKVMVIFAAYDESEQRVKAVYYEEKELTGSYNEITATLSDISEAKVLKMFIWDTTMSPFAMKAHTVQRVSE